MHARKSLLYSGNEPWMKKNGGIFDVIIGAFDRAEICELVGICLLSQITETYDGLSAFKDESGPQSEKIKKVRIIFTQKGLTNNTILEIENCRPLRRYL